MLVPIYVFPEMKLHGLAISKIKFVCFVPVWISKMSTSTVHSILCLGVGGTEEPETWTPIFAFNHISTGSVFLQQNIFLHRSIALQQRTDLWRKQKPRILKGTRSCDNIFLTSRVVRASGCQCQSRNSPGFVPSIIRHSGIWGAADEAVLSNVHKKKKSKNSS